VAALFDGFKGRRPVTAVAGTEPTRQQTYAANQSGKNGIEKIPDPKPAGLTEFGK
jgi:hypothetical protein